MLKNSVIASARLSSILPSALTYSPELPPLDAAVLRHSSGEGQAAKPPMWFVSTGCSADNGLLRPYGEVRPTKPGLVQPCIAIPMPL